MIPHFCDALGPHIHWTGTGKKGGTARFVSEQHSRRSLYRVVLGEHEEDEEDKTKIKTVVGEYLCRSCVVRWFA